MSATTLAWIVLAAPMAGLFYNLIVGSSVSRKHATWAACASVLVSFAAAVGVLIALLQRSPDDRQLVSTGWTWLSGGQLHEGFSILVDPLSAVMLLVVSGVGFLIHAYSVGYMHGDREEKRFFAYLNLFVFSMLLLVLAGNFLILLIGWGLVGLSSYLLIGYWWERPAAVQAAKKAFVMNAIGDVGIALALFLLWGHTHSLDVLGTFSAVDSLPGSTTTWIAGLLLVGAIAKSAQLPLHTWLPDAMEGPTPVSALIHAATMVTAGVYLVARCWPIFRAAPEVSDLTALIGVATLTMAGLIALVQTDIKRVIAYSTMSQIGYMFCAVGIGATSAGMFHLVTHAFFKALLFLGAGVVIHALADEQDIRKMGGLGRYLPYTRTLMWIGALALAGVPPFAGFFSKDQILAAGLARADWVGYLVFGFGLAGAFVTALYTFRMIFIVFHGEPTSFARTHAEKHAGHGEGPFSMIWTISVLALGAVTIGFLELPGVSHAMRTFLEPVAPNALEASTSQETLASLLAVSLGVIGIAAAWLLYGRRSDAPRKVAEQTAPLESVLQRKLGFDELYDWAFHRPAVALARGGARAWEGPVVTGSMDLVGATGGWLSRVLGAGQSGLVRVYALVLALGLAALAAWFMAGAS